MTIHITDVKELEMQLLKYNDNYEMQGANEETRFFQKHNKDIMKINNKFGKIVYLNFIVQILYNFIMTQEKISQLTFFFFKKDLASFLDHICDFVEYEHSYMIHMMAVA